LVKIIRLKRCHLGRDVINFIKHILLFAVIILYSCEDMYEPEKDHIDCFWFQYAEQQIYYCEDVSWCDETIYPNEKVRRAWILYIGKEPTIRSQLRAGGVDRIFYWSGKSECISYYEEENEIFFNLIDQGAMKESTDGYIKVFQSR
jgi:hypothetical protein